VVRQAGSRWLGSGNPSLYSGSRTTVPWFGQQWEGSSVPAAWLVLSQQVVACASCPPWRSRWWWEALQESPWWWQVAVVAWHCIFRSITELRHPRQVGSRCVSASRWVVGWQAGGMWAVWVAAVCGGVVVEEERPVHKAALFHPAPARPQWGMKAHPPR